jgi:hypothetical protein
MTATIMLAVLGVALMGAGLLRRAPGLGRLRVPLFARVVLLVSGAGSIAAVSILLLSDRPEPSPTMPAQPVAWSDGPLPGSEDGYSATDRWVLQNLRSRPTYQRLSDTDIIALGRSECQLMAMGAKPDIIVTIAEEKHISADDALYGIGIYHLAYCATS